MKDIITVYGEKTFELHLPNKNFKTPIGFFSLQGSPELLLPWMVYIIVNLIATTVLFIVQATLYFAIQDTSAGYGNIAAAIIYFCK